MSIFVRVLLTIRKYIPHISLFLEQVVPHVRRVRCRQLILTVAVVAWQIFAVDSGS